MKIFYTLLLLIVTATFGICAENKKNEWGENSDAFKTGFSSQEAVSDTKFKKTVEAIKEKALTKKQKKIRDTVKPISPAYDETHLDNFANNKDDSSDVSNTHTVMIPVTAFDETGQYISPGYYKLSCKKSENNKYYLELSQGTKTIASIRAKETSEDLEQEKINFCDAEIIENGRIRLIYGSIELNLVGYIYYKDN